MFHETSANGALTLRLGSSFAPEDALRIHELVERAAPGTPVEIDFRCVRECHDFALSLLARDILGSRARVAVHGMSKHQQRLLGYLGVPSARAAGAASERA